MSFWKIDLTTQDGAENAAGTGGYACFIAGVLALIGAAMFYPSLKVGAVPLSAFIGALVEALLFFLAGRRLRAGKGAYLSVVVAALMAIELVMKLISVSVVGIVINAVLLIVIINGVRGVWALRRNDFPEELGEVFD